MRIRRHQRVAARALTAVLCVVATAAVGFVNAAIASAATVTYSTTVGASDWTTTTRQCSTIDNQEYPPVQQLVANNPTSQTLSTGDPGTATFTFDPPLYVHSPVVSELDVNFDFSPNGLSGGQTIPGATLSFTGTNIVSSVASTASLGNNSTLIGQDFGYVVDSRNTTLVPDPTKDTIIDSASVSFTVPPGPNGDPDYDNADMTSLFNILATTSCPDPGPGMAGGPFDSTAPVASPTQSPAANANGWNNSDVTVDWNWADETGGSGIDTSNCTTQSTSSGEGNALSLSASCKDLAGNVGSASYSVNVDKTAPSLAPSVAPNPVLLGGTATASPNATDGLSGVASSSCDPVDTSTPGPQSVSCAATDNADNQATGSAGYVVGLDVIHLAPATNALFRAGTTVPVKFQLAGANGQAIAPATAESFAACTVTVTYPARAPTCATYKPSDGYFHANVTTPTDAPLGVPLSLAVGASVSSTPVASASLVVVPVPTLTIADASVRAPAHGTVMLAVRISLSAPSAQTITLDWATAAGTASSPADYWGQAAAVSIPAGQTSIVVHVQVRAKPNAVPNKTFSTFVWNAKHALVTRTIANDTIIGHK